MLFMEIPTYRRLNIQEEYGMSRTYKLTMNKVEQFKWNLMEQERSEATIEKYIRDINAFFEWLPEGKRVDKPVTIAYKQSLLERGYASSSINSMVAALNSFFSYSEWGDCRIRPLRIQAQTMVSEERKLTKEEYKRLLHAAKEKNERLYLVMQSICSVGLRVSELKFLTVEAVHRGRTVVNNKGKDAHGRAAAKAVSHPEAVLQAPESNGREHLCKPYGTSAGPLQYLECDERAGESSGCGSR